MSAQQATRVPARRRSFRLLPVCGCPRIAEFRAISIFLPAGPRRWMPKPGGGAGSESARQAGCSGQVVKIRAGWFNLGARAGFLEFRPPQGAARVSRDANPLPAISFDLR